MCARTDPLIEGFGSKTVIEIGDTRGQDREEMDVLGYHMQTIIPDFRREGLDYAQAQMQCCCCWLSATMPRSGLD
jgi:hypothetical protein